MKVLPRDDGGTAIQFAATLAFADGADVPSPRVEVSEVQEIQIPVGAICLIFRASTPVKFGTDGDLEAFAVGDEGIDYRIPCRKLEALYVDSLQDGVEWDLYYYFEMLDTRS